MDLQTLIATRQSCRKYDKNKKVANEDIITCLEAARLAPSACNGQPWHFTVCADKYAAEVSACTQLMGINKFASDAPNMIVISESSYNAAAVIASKVKNHDFRSIDIGIATAQLVLAAQSCGLATCIIGVFDEKKIQKIVNTKDRIRLIISLGYAADDDVLRPKKRKKLDEIASFMK